MHYIFIENELLTRIISVIALTIEIPSVKIFFVNKVHLEFNKKNLLLFFIICSFAELISTMFLPVIAFSVINIAITFSCLLALFFRKNFTKGLFILLISVSTFQLVEFLSLFIYSSIFHINPIYLIKFPVINIVVTFASYFLMFMILDFFNKINLTESFSYEFGFYNKFIIILFSCMSLFSVLLSMFIVCKFFNTITFFLFLILVILNLFLFAILIMLIMKTFDFEKIAYEFNLEKKSYDSLCNSYDGIREFKHDFSNIMQSIGGYLFTDDLEGLKLYYSSIFKECNELKRISLLNKDVFNSPPVLSLVSEKYNKAKDLGIDFNIEVLLDFNTLNMDIYEFTRILGIFLDNSIEAASNSSQKVINILINKDIRNHFDSIVIENSCQGATIDTSKIFDKNFSTKPKNTGLGLWKVKKILKNYDNIFLNTSVNNNLFRHQLKIYY